MPMPSPSCLAGQATNLLFGRIYDSHLPTSTFSVAAGGGSPPTCTAGRACYIRATYLTCGMSLVATVVGLVLALGRKEMRTRAV